MRFLKRYFYTIVPLFSDITSFYCILQLASFSSKNSMIVISFPRYFALACLAALVNCLLGRKERTLVTIVAVNAAVAICSEIVMFISPHNIYGFIGYTATAFMFLYPACRSFFLSRNLITLDRMLRYCEMSVMGTGIFIAFQLGYFTPTPISTPLCLIALALNLLALSSLRLSGSQMKTQTAGAQRVFILGIVTAVLFAAAISLGLLVPVFRSSIIYALGIIKSILQAILKIISEFFMFLISLIPVGEYEALPPESGMQGTMPDGAEELVEVPVIVAYVLFFIICAVVAAACIYLLYRFRKLRLRAFTADSIVSKDTGVFSLAGLLRALFKRLINYISFYLRLLFLFNTYSGVFVRLELRAKRRGKKRSAAQTPREFLTALAIYAEENARAALLELAAQIDLQCFQAGGSPSRKMAPAQIRVIFRGLRVPRHKRLRHKRMKSG